MNQSDQKFSTEEWEICLKVLDALKEEPFLNPDNKTFSGLITKIHKSAKRQSRHENYSEIASGVGGTSGSHQRIDPSTIFDFRCPLVSAKSPTVNFASSL